MPSDPLALAALSAGLPLEAEYDAVYAAVTATERGRWFLTEYASRNRHADTDLIVTAIARMEAIMRGDAPPQSVLPGGELAEIAATIERLRAVIAADTRPAANIAAATERIQDICFSLRERAVDTALCEALEAAVLDISEACAAGSANNEPPYGAIALLRELADRLDALIALSSADPVANPITEHSTNDPVAPSAMETARHEDKKFTDAVTVPAVSTSGEEPGTAVDAREAASDPVMPPTDHATDHAVDAAEPADGPPRSYIEPPDFAFHRAAEKPDKESIEPPVESAALHAASPEARRQPSPQENPAAASAVAPPPVPAPVSTTAPAPVASPGAVASTPEVPSPPQPTANDPMASAVKPVPAPSDPLEAMRNLSAEELIALFG